MATTYSNLYASIVIAKALAEEGYMEKESNSNLDDKKANAGDGNFTKYARDYYKHSGISVQGQPWCDVFVDEMFIAAFGVEAAKKLLGGFSAYTPTSAQYLKNMGQWHTTPKVGDIIFFTNGTRICHTGIVYKVTATMVYTIEGNTSNGSTLIPNGGMVCKKSYQLSYARIAGYGRPAYSTEATTSTNSAPTVSASTFDFENWVRRLQKAIGAEEDGDPGPETLSKTVTIKYGSTGTVAALVQERLISLGYSCGSAGADGEFKDYSRAAAIKYQMACGLSKKDADGIITASGFSWKKMLKLA